MKRLGNLLLAASLGMLLLFLSYKIIDLYIIKIGFLRFIAVDLVFAGSFILLSLAISQLDKSQKDEDKIEQP